MKLTRLSSNQDLEQRSPVVWESTGNDPAFTFEVSPDQKGFIGFFLSVRRGALSPSLEFDQGSGFSAATAMALKAFPFAFYHVALDRMRSLERIRLRPGTAPATFRLVSIQTRSAILVAVLHYLFNLRYQNITVTAPKRAGRMGGTAWLAANTSRILNFFRDVSKGDGIRVQEGSDDVLPKLSLFLANEAFSVHNDVEARLTERTSPLLSFVCPTFNTKTSHLKDLLQSFLDEHAGYAELVLTDDGSTSKETLAALAAAQSSPGIRVVFNERNAGIAAATNSGIQMAGGDWIAFIDHDDLFARGAIAVIAQAILSFPDAQFFYTDEVIVDSELRAIGTFCKPAFDSVLLSGVNYINHFSVFRRTRLNALGNLRTDHEGSQDYDLLLRYLADAAPGTVVHIPFFAYMWRRDEDTYSTVNVERAVASARSALLHAMQASGWRGEILPALHPNLHRICYTEDERPRPSVSVIIPTKNKFHLITRVIDDLRRRTDFPNLDIVVVDNGSTDADVLAFYRSLAPEHGIVVDLQEEPFNFASMCNRGSRLAKGDVFLFLNNDIEVLDPDWLTEMVACLSFPSVGIVGAQLLYPDRSVQHNGVIVGLGGLAGHWYIEAPLTDLGPMSRFAVRQTLSAVTGACMLITRPCFERIGGFDEEAFPIAYNDIDFCLRAKAAGYRTLWTPFARLLHHESASRGSDQTAANNPRFLREGERLRQRHATESYIDDAYHPFYDRRHSRPHLIVPPSLPMPRPNVFP